MGKFANVSEGQGMMIGPGVETEGDSGFAAMGKPVPMHRRAAAQEHVKDMYGRPLTTEEKEKVFSVIEKMSNYIERDNSHAAMECCLAGKHNPDGILDATGVYRLLAVLLTATKPVEPPKDLWTGDTELPHASWLKNRPASDYNNVKGK